MSANVTFSLCAATVSLVISSLSALKGRWAVAIVFGLLVVGFLVRALEGRREAARQVPGVSYSASFDKAAAIALSRPCAAC